MACVVYSLTKERGGEKENGGGERKKRKKKEEEEGEKRGKEGRNLRHRLNFLFVCVLNVSSGTALSRPSASS